MTRPRCYLDIEIDNEPVGRIIVELFNEICPITCENFRALCTGEKGLGQTTKKPLWYKNTLFHRVVKNFVIQSGDFESGNGTGGESIYGGQFADENFTLSHDKPFLLSMANKGKNTNGSQFFITLQSSPHLDQLHTVFGHVICGHEVIKQIENIKIDQNNKPLKEVKIAQCGELVLRSEKRKKRKESTSESSSSEEEKRKKRKKHKKEKKKNKKDKKAKGFYSSSNKPEDDIACNVDPDEIPAVPANVFLMRRTSPVEDREYRRAPRGRENFQFKRYPPSRSRSGRKVKGRGNMRYRTPSSSDERSGSETPPHWKQAQSRLKKLKEVIKDKDKDKDSASDVSNEEDGENKSPHNPFLQSRLGLVSTKKFDDDNRRNFGDERRKDFDEERRRNFEDRRRDFGDDRRRDFNNDRRRGEFDGERSFSDDRRKKDARMNINENRRRRDFSPESSKYNRDNDEPENLFDKLMHEDQQHGTSWFDEKDQDQSDEESQSSPVRSKVVVKSSVSRKDTRDDRRDERESNRRYNENNRRRDSPYKRSRDRHRESSSGRDNSYRKSEHPTENRKETSKNASDKKNENPKKLSGKTKKRLNLLENDLFRYTKQEIIPKKDDKLDSETNDEKNTNKQEEVIQASLINSVNNSNLAALKEYETKSNEKCGHESNGSMQAELSKHGSEKSKHKAEENLLEALSVKSNIEPLESQVSDSSSLQKVVEYETGKEQEADPSIKVSSNFRQLGSLSIPAPDEELSTESETNEKERSPLSNSKYYESDKTEVQKPVERDEQKSQHVEKEVEKFIKCEKENEYNLPDVIPLPDDNVRTEDTIVKRSTKIKIEATGEKEIETQNTSADLQVAENSSIVSLKTTRDEFQGKEKKIKHESRQKISPHRRQSPSHRRNPSPPSRHSPNTPPRRSPSTPPRHSPSTPPRHSPSTPPRRSPSPPRRHSPSPPRRHSPSPPRRHSPSPPRRRSSSPPRRRSPSPPRRRSPSPPRRHSPSPNQEPQRSDKKIYSRMSVSPSRSKSPLHHKTVNQSDNQKPSSSKQSLHSRRSKSPVNRAKSPISRRKRPDTKTSKSRSRSRSARRSTSRNRVRRKYSRSPNVRQRRSRSRSRSRNAGRGSRSYRHSGIRNRSPELRSSFQRRNRSPYRGRARGRSASRRSNTRSRSHSFDKKHRRRRQVSSSSSSSSSSRSDNVKRRNLKNSGAKGRNKRRSSSSSSSASSRSKRSNS